MNIDGADFYLRVSAKTKASIVTYVFEKKLAYTRLTYLRKKLASVANME